MANWQILFRNHYLILALVLYQGQGFSSDASPVKSLSGWTMATRYNIRIATEKALPDQLQKNIDSKLVSINQKLSTYIDESEISRFNNANTAAFMPVSPDFMANYKISLEVHQLTAGAFDPTIGPVVELWGFSKAKTPVPSLEAVKSTLKSLGIHKIQRQGSHRLSKTAPGIRLDFSGVAKGYAVDEVARLLEQNGFRDYLVEIGGEVRTSGHKPGKKPWALGIEAPSYSQRQLFTVIHLSGEAMATSGSYRNYREVDGKRLSHLIDPRTGMPSTHTTASVTVLDTRCSRADAIATGFIIMGHKEAMEIANQQNIPAYFIVKEGERFEGYSSRAFLKHQEKYKKKR